MPKFDADEILSIVQGALDHAEGVWNKHGVALRERAVAKSVIMDSVENLTSRIPGHEYVADDQEKVSTFIALVADIRNSSQHLLCAISGKEADVSELQRVYYETSALLPALERTIQYEDGSVTEYLGDGILSLFYVEEGDKKSAIYAAHRAAKNCVTETLRIANDELNARYRLPPLQIGIGLAMSPALISLVGLPGNSHPKAIGRCVYNATKLSGGRNEILVDTNINREWPTSEGGRLKFIPRTMHNVSGYLIRRKND